MSGCAFGEHEIAAGRLRQSVAALDAGWRPAPRNGQDRHLDGGRRRACTSGAGACEERPIDRVDGDAAMGTLQ